MKPGAVDSLCRERVSDRSPFPAILMIGYGNPLRGDDALGPEIADQLARRFDGDSRVQVQTVHQLTLDIAETLANFSLIILIDAREAEPLGEIYCQKIQASQRLPQPFSHYLNPDELLGACQILYGTTPEMILTGIHAHNFGIGEPISPLVKERMAELIAEIEKIVAARCSCGGSLGMVQ